MTTTQQSMPVVLLSVAPRVGADADRFAAGIREYATRLNAAGVVFVTSHRDRSSDSSNVIVEVDDLRPDEGPAFSSRMMVPSASAFALSERTAQLLNEHGVATEFGRTWRRHNTAWASMLTAHKRAAFPLIHVSVPSRFAKRVMSRVTNALQPLRSEGILLVGISAAFAEAIRQTTVGRRADEHELAAVEGAPI